VTELLLPVTIGVELMARPFLVAWQAAREAYRRRPELGLILSLIFIVLDLIVAFDVRIPW
jgi:hypothetical protein